MLARPTVKSESVEIAVSEILENVARNGDRALRSYTKRFDNASISELQVSANEINAAEQRVPVKLKTAIAHAKSNIEKFHTAQIENPRRIETTKGVVCWRKSVAIEKVGLYVPGGTAPLFSTVLMLAIPAKIAGCKEIVMCSPPDENGNINDVVLYTAKLCGVTSIFKVGGAQAIGAMAFGTDTISKVYKIFGPGNQFVTTAKQIASAKGVAIDMPAGPSEVAIFADENCVAEFVAADLLSQAEHGEDSQVLLITTSEEVIKTSLAELKKTGFEFTEKSNCAKILAEFFGNSCKRSD